MLRNGLLDRVRDLHIKLEGRDDLELSVRVAVVLNYRKERLVGT